MRKSYWGTIGLVVMALAGCRTPAQAPDVGALRDAAPAPYDGGPPPMDAGRVGLGSAYIRLVNLIPASPNLTVCLATIPGTGIAPTTAHILGSPDARLMSDGTLPYPGVSPYLPAPIFDTPGFGYEIRLYSREDVPFVALGECPAAGAAPAPVLTIRADASAVTPGSFYAAVLIGVLPGTPVTCSGTCPAPRVSLIQDDLTPPPPGNHVRSRLFQGVPNLPAPIHVCFDADYVDAAHPGFLSPARVLPPAADTDGIAFGEVTPFIDIPPVTRQGAFYTHATVTGVSDCNPATLLLGPTTVPLPVPPTAPIEVARVFGAGDVITSFAFGRVGPTCTSDTDCRGAGSLCTTAPCTCDGTGHCTDDLAGNLLPWRDVVGGQSADAGVDAGGADAGVDGGT